MSANSAKGSKENLPKEVIFKLRSAKMEHRAGEQGSVAIRIRDETNINVQGAKG